MLSGHLRKGRLTGTWKETTLIPSQKRIFPPFVLLVGLGKEREYSYPRLRELFPFLLNILKNLDVSKICFSFPEDEEHQVELGKLAEVLMEEIVDSVEKRPSGLEEDWVRHLTLVFAEGPRGSDEILLGVQTAQSIFEDRLEINIRVSP